MSRLVKARMRCRSCATGWRDRRVTFRLEPTSWDFARLYRAAGKREIDDLCDPVTDVTADEANFAAALRCYAIGYLRTDILETVPRDRVPRQLRAWMEPLPALH